MDKIGKIKFQTTNQKNLAKGSSNMVLTHGPGIKRKGWAPPQGVAVSAAPALLALLVLRGPWVAAARATPGPTQGPSQGGLAGRSW